MQSINRAQNITVYFFMFFINFQELSLFNIEFFSIPKLTGFIYLVTIFPQLRKYTKTNGIKKFIIPVVLFFGLLTLISLANINEISHKFINISILQNVILFLVLINHGRSKFMVLEKGLLSLALGSVVLAFFYNSGIGVEISEGRVSLFGDNENMIGLRMSISIMILVLAAVQNRLQLGWYRYLLLLPIPIMLKLMAETGSRVALVSFVLAFIAGVSLYKTKKYWMKIGVVIIGLVAFIYSMLLIIKSEALLLRLLMSYEKGDLAGREAIWQSLLPHIKSNLFFGFGETGYAYLFGEGSPHNVILEVLCYTGIFGLSMYLYFLYQICRSACKCKKSSGYLLSILLLSPIFGFILSGQILTQKLCWVIFAYIASMSIVESKVTEVNNKKVKTIPLCQA